MNIEIKKLKSCHAEEAAALIRRTFSELVGSSFTAEGKKAFLSETTADKIGSVVNKTIATSQHLAQKLWNSHGKRPQG